jgi:predicted nucleic acid-binding protein
LGNFEEGSPGGTALSFIDSSVFLYAFLTPRGELPSEIMEHKRRSQDILRRVQDGERVVTSAAHITEITNILESRFSLSTARHTLSQVLLSENVEIAGVDRLRYEAALAVSERHDLGLNDAVAYTLMLEKGITSIYSHDKHFDNLPGIQRLIK